MRSIVIPPLPHQQKVVEEAALRGEWFFISGALPGLDADLEGVERMIVQDPDSLPLWESRAEILEATATMKERYEELLGMLEWEAN